MEFNNPIIGEEELIRSAIRSDNYVAGVSGWRIAADGTAEFTGAIVSGTVHVGDASDYVEILPTPKPTIYFSTSDPSQVAPAAIGMGAIGGNTIFFQGPDMGSTDVDYLSFTGDTTAAGMQTEFGYNGTFVITSSQTASPSFSMTSGDNVNISTDSSSQLRLNTKLFMVNGVDRGQGLKNYTAITANTGTVTTTETVGITSASVTFENGRAYRVTVHGLLQSSVAADRARTRTRRTNAAGTILMDTMDSVVIPANNTNVVFDYSQVVVNTSGSNIADVLVVTYHRIAGTGNVRLAADATNPAWIEIRDIGIATDYPNARAL